MIYSLPTSLTVGGVEREINSDWRYALDCIEALQDNELTESDKVVVLLKLIYKEPISLDDTQEAAEQAVWFLSGGQNDDGKKSPKLMDWEQDFPYIITPINRIAGREIRSVEYLHWWTFLGYYAEVGDCTFAQIVRIRNMKLRGKKMDKADQTWYRENRDLVDIKTRYTAEEEKIMKMLGV